jgi:hypothetical protein
MALTEKDVKIAAISALSVFIVTLLIQKVSKESK